MPDFETRIVTKIREGTARSDVHLCDSCRSHSKRRGAIPAGDTARCSVFIGPIRGKIAECSQYYPANLPSAYEYEDTAWILGRNKADDPVFIPPRTNQLAQAYDEDRDE